MLGLLRPKGGAAPTSPEAVDREEARVIMGRVRGWKAPEQCASRQKRT